MSRKKKSSSKKPWVLPRHAFFRRVLGIVFLPYVKKKYNIKITTYDGDNRPMLILYNHQTAYDQFFVGGAFKRPIYYVATEDIFSMGFLSKIIKFLVAPIPIKKQTTDARAVINCIRVAKEGGAIAIAPEGNRTYSGETVYIKPSITSLARHLRLPIALFRIEGGYGMQPRWSDVVRKGEMKAGVSRVIEPEEYSDLSDDELYKLICDGLYQNEACVGDEYHSPVLAEYLERAIYVCPECGLSEFKSEGDVIECTRCGKKARYTSTKELVGVDSEFPFRFVKDWYDYQSNFINNLKLTEMPDEALYTEKVDLFEVLLYKKKRKIHTEAEIALYPSKITVKADEVLYDFEFDKLTAVSVLGKNKLNIYSDGKVYQIKGSERFCALKYVNLCYRYKNIIKGDENDTFLGL